MVVAILPLVEEEILPSVVVVILPLVGDSWVMGSWVMGSWVVDSLEVDMKGEVPWEGVACSLEAEDCWEVGY